MSEGSLGAASTQLDAHAAAPRHRVAATNPCRAPSNVLASVFAANASPSPSLALASVPSRADAIARSYAARTASARAVDPRAASGCASRIVARYASRTSRSVSVAASRASSPRRRSADAASSEDDAATRDARRGGGKRVGANPSARIEVRRGFDAKRDATRR